MLPRERLEKIKQIAIKDSKVYVAKLSEMFDVTEETIRRDLEKLETQGIVTKTYGGAILNLENTKEDIPFSKRATTNLESKQKIAHRIKDLFGRGTTIVADSSSTSMEVIKFLKDRGDIHLITNSVEIFHDLSEFDINILSTGGSYNKYSKSLQGIIAKDNIKKYNVDIALISCKGIDIEKGILESNELEAELKREMIKQASKVILLVDNSKFNKTAFVKLFEYSDIDCIVTDKMPSEEWIDLFCEKEIELIY